MSWQIVSGKEKAQLPHEEHGEPWQVSHCQLMQQESCNILAAGPHPVWGVLESGRVQDQNQVLSLVIGPQRTEVTTT